MVAKGDEGFTFGRAARCDEKEGLVLCFAQRPNNTERTNRSGLYRQSRLRAEARPMEFHGMDLPTIVALVALSLVLTWAISALLEAKDEKKREREMRKALDRVVRGNGRPTWEDRD